MYWSPSTGAQTVSGALRDAWAAQGWETGRLGYPTSGEMLTRDGRQQTFQGGTIAIELRTGRVIYR